MFKKSQESLVAAWGVTLGWRMLLAFLLLAVLGMPGWAGEGPVTIRAQGVPSAAETGINARIGRLVLKSFLEQHPDIEIEPFLMPEIGGVAAMDSGPLMAIAAGIPPHVIYVNFRMSSTFLNQGFLAPMEVLLARINSANPLTREVDSAGRWRADPSEAEVASALAQIRERIPDRVWPVIYREDFHHPGRKHVWSLPTSVLVKALFYRKDLFIEAGLDPERPPQTWDELLEYARALRVPEKSQYGMYFSMGSGISYRIYSLLVTNGARAVEQDEDGVWRAVFDSREAAEAILFFWRLVREPFERDGRVIDQACAFDAGQAWLAWQRGQVGMQFSYLDDKFMAQVNPQMVGIAPVPASPRGSGASDLNAAMLGVFSGSSPQQQLAAMRYIWFRTGVEGRKIFTRTMVENGYGRFVNPDLLEEFGYTRLLEQIPEGWYDAFRNALANGVPEPYGRNTQAIYRWMSEPINRAVYAPLGAMEEEEALAQVMAWSSETVEEFNRKVLGHLPPAEMRQRRMVGSAIMLLVAFAFATSMWRVWRHFSLVADAGGAGGGSGQHTRRWGYALLIPAMALVVGWMYLPLFVGGITMAFMDYRLILDSSFVGVDNFANALFDERFWTALGRTFYFVLLTIGLGFWPPILLAILLQEIPTNTAKYVYRTIFYLPAILSGLVVMFLWKQFYEPGSEGVLNQLIMSVNGLGPVPATLLKWALLAFWVAFLGTLVYLPIRVNEMSKLFKGLIWVVAAGGIWITLKPLWSAPGLSALQGLVGSFEVAPMGWLTDPATAMLCIVIPHVWAASGPGCILYLAALKSIPEELYEAAEIDGASTWHKVCYIVLPRLKYLIIIQFIWAVIGAFKGGAEMILVMTAGGPLDATTILSLEIFFTTFMDLNYGLGTAMAWMLGALLIGFTAYQMKMLSQAEFRTADTVDS